MTAVWQASAAAYAAADNLVGVNPSGQTTCLLGGVWYSRCFTYDWQKRLTAATNPESNTTSYSYDGNGNVLTKTDGRGVQTTMTYDTALNRVLTKTYPAGTPNVTYTYDDPAVQFSRGRLTKVDSSATTWRILAYDVLGRPTSTRRRPVGRPTPSTTTATTWRTS